MERRADMTCLQFRRSNNSALQSFSVPLHCALVMLTVIAVDARGTVARLFISYKSTEANYAFAVRQGLIDRHNWPAEDIFVGADHLRAGDV